MKTRTYRQFCAIARALDTVGQRWTLLIVRELLLGSWRYSDLLGRLHGLAPNLLAARLREMEQNGLIFRRRLPAPSGAMVYQLTEAGRDLDAVCVEIARFGERFLGAPKSDDKLDPGWELLALKRRYVGVGSVSATLRIGDTSFSVRASPAEVDVRFGVGFGNGEADVQAAMAAETLRALLRRGASAEVLEQAGHLFVAGSRLEWERFLAAFGLRN